MNIDPIAAVGAVTRELKMRDHEGKPAHVVVASRVYDTTIDDVWDALTNAERVPRWFAPVSGELKLGGRYAIKGNASGTVTSCEPPKKFALTWEFGGGVSWVNVTLSEVKKEKTRLVLEHIAHLDDEERWKKFGPGAVGVGWDLGLVGLAIHIESGGSVTHEEAEAWSMSDEGKKLIRGASEDWGRASIAFGTPEAEARAAAATTSGFYTGEAPPGNDGG